VAEQDTVPFSWVVDQLVEAGQSDDCIEAVRSDLFEKHPELEQEAFANAMSTLPDDPVVPRAWAEKILVEMAGIPPGLLEH
jgi:hypothetical protein